MVRIVKKITPTGNTGRVSVYSTLFHLLVRISLYVLSQSFIC